MIRFVADFYAAHGQARSPAEALLRQIIDGKVQTSEADVTLGSTPTGDNPRRPRRLRQRSEGEGLDRKEPCRPTKGRVADRRAMASWMPRIRAAPAMTRRSVSWKACCRSNPPRRKTASHLAQMYLAVGSWTKANAQFRSLLISYGNESTFLTAYIVALLQHGETANAEVYLDRLEKIAPNAVLHDQSARRVAGCEGRDGQGLGLAQRIMSKTPMLSLPTPCERTPLGGRRDRTTRPATLTRPGQKPMAEQFARRARVLYQSYVDAQPETDVGDGGVLGSPGRNRLRPWNCSNATRRQRPPRLGPGLCLSSS